MPIKIEVVSTDEYTNWIETLLNDIESEL
jgi:heme/copper-type cytochrome/quinol oxidase subunit 2